MAKKKTRLSKREVDMLIRIQRKIDKMRIQYDEENDIELQVDGNGTIGDALSNASGSLEIILQEY